MAYHLWQVLEPRTERLYKPLENPKSRPVQPSMHLVVQIIQVAWLARENLHVGRHSKMQSMTSSELWQILISKVSDLRWWLFKTKQEQSERLPLIPDVVHQAILRAHHQLLLWNSATVANPEIPSPDGYGWNRDDDEWVPIMTNQYCSWWSVPVWKVNVQQISVVAGKLVWTAQIYAAVLTDVITWRMSMKGWSVTVMTIVTKTTLIILTMMTMMDKCEVIKQLWILLANCAVLRNEYRVKTMTRILVWPYRPIISRYKVLYNSMHSYTGVCRCHLIILLAYRSL